jgi:hypothetical protein
MSRWSDQFSGNAIHQTLKQLDDWLSTDVPGIDAEHDVEKRRLQKSLQIVAEVVANIDPEFFPEQYLTQLNQLLSQPPIWNSVQTYFTSPATQYLRDANEGMTVVASTVTQLAALSQPRASRDVLKSIEAAHDVFHKKINDIFSKFENEIAKNTSLLEQLQLQQNALNESQAALKQNVESSFSSWQAAYTDAQTKRAEEFSSSQIERAKKFDETLREWTAKFDTEVKDVSTAHTSKLLTAFEKYRSDVDAMILDMKAKHEAILSIHGLVGTDGVAGGYQKGATDEQKAANFWRGVSMGALTIAAIWILAKYCLGFELTQAGEVNWAQIATAVSLTVVLVGAAGYAARQSKMHREAEQHMRWFALEVKAIDPFLSSLPDEQQNDIKNQLVQKLFGQNRLSADKSEGSIDPAAFKSVADSLIGIIKAMGRG